MSHHNSQNPSKPVQQLYDQLTAKPDACTHYNDLMHQAAQLEADDINIDLDSRFSAFLEHLDVCLDCAEEYAGLVSMFREYYAAEKPVVLQKQRTFFPKPEPTAERKDPKKWLKLWQSAKRQLELTIPSINLQPMVPTMATTALYNSQLTELAGKPFFIVSLIDTQNPPVLKVVLREPQEKSWQVHIQTQQNRYSQITTKGIAEFATIPVDELSQGFVLTCDEL